MYYGWKVRVPYFVMYKYFGDTSHGILNVLFKCGYHTIALCQKFKDGTLGNVGCLSSYPSRSTPLLSQTFDIANWG